MLHAVGTGGMFFGEKVEKGNCLYIALEDNARRLQSRIKSQGVPRDASITFVREWLPLQGKGYDQLVKEITEGNYRLIVIDTLTRAFPGLDQNDQTQISRVMDSIQRLSADNNVAIIFIDHTAKPKGINSDPIDDIMNSTVKVAVSDQILALYKEQGKAGARLKGRGRELEEIDYSLSWDRDFCIWQKEGDTNEVRISREKQDIIESLKELGKASNSDIAKYLGKDRGNIHRTLSNLVNDGLVRREDIQGKKYYELSEVVQHNTTYTTLHNTHNNYNTDYEEEF
jgi:RecA-family ATPase